MIRKEKQAAHFFQLFYLSSTANKFAVCMGVNVGNCKNCFTTIPDGQIFCEECAKIKEESSASENYLDSLLNSVADIRENEEDKVQRILEKRKRKEKEQQEKNIDIDPIAKEENQDSSESLVSDILEQNEILKEVDTELDMGDMFSIMGSNDELMDTGEQAERLDTEPLEEPIDDLKLDVSEEMDDELKAAMPEWENELQMDIPEEESKLQTDVLEELESEQQIDIPEEEESELQIDIPEEEESELQIDIPEEEENELLLDNSEEDVNVDDLLNFMEKDNSNEERELDSLQDNSQEDDLSSEEILSLDDLLGSIGEDEEVLDEQSVGESEAGIDLGTIFSDALGAVSELEDLPEETDGTSELIAAVEAENEKKEKKKKRDKKEKKSIFKKLFSNIIDEKDEKDFVKQQEEAEKAKSKKEKKAKKKNNGKGNNGEEEATPKEKGIKGLLQMFKKDGKEQEEKKAEKLNKQEEKKRKKQEKKEKEPEVEVYQGKINKFGAALVFTFFGLVLVGILAGTDIFSYSQGIALARENFKNKKYDIAYSEIQGLKVRGEDTELLDQIMTVMFVDKQLISYHNFYSRKDYTKALDSLLKGLKRYDKYIELGRQLGVESDLNYVRAQLIDKLYHSFQLTEAEALDIIKSESQTDYSMKVYSTVAEKVPELKDVTE